MQMIEKLKKEDKLSRALSLLNIENLVRKIKNRRVVKEFCSAGTSYFTVSSSGGFYVCHRFNENHKYQIGNIKAGIDFEKSKEIKSKNKTEQEPCKSCWVKNLCQGGCLYEHRNSPSKDEFFCKLQKMEVELALFYIKSET